MEDITVQMRLPRTVRVFLSLMIMVLSFCFCGCSSKSTVTCIPDEEYSPQEEQSQLTSQDDVNDEISKALRQYFTSWQGTRYRYGGLSRKGVDCSGFSLLTYKEIFGRNLPRTVREQVKEGARISKASLQAGDLVFF